MSSRTRQIEIGAQPCECHLSSAAIRPRITSPALRLGHMGSCIHTRAVLAGRCTQGPLRHIGGRLAVPTGDACCLPRGGHFLLRRSMFQPAERTTHATRVHTACVMLMPAQLAWRHSLRGRRRGRLERVALRHGLRQTRRQRMTHKPQGNPQGKACTRRRANGRRTTAKTIDSAANGAQAGTGHCRNREPGERRRQDGPTRRGWLWTRI